MAHEWLGLREDLPETIGFSLQPTIEFYICRHQNHCLVAEDNVRRQGSSWT